MNPITARPASGVTTPQQAPPRRSRVEHLVWAAPVVAMAALGLFDLGVPQLWRDEFATWSAATRTLPQLWAMLHNTDAVLGVYYFGLHFWIAVFGASPVAMRLPSVIAMVIAAGVVGLIGRRLAGNAAGVAGGLIFALIPSVSRYAQEARPYAFATMFAALATLLFLRAMERPNWSRWAIYAVVLAAAGTANLIALSVVAGHVLILLWDFLQRTVRMGGDGTPESGRRIPGGRIAPEGAPLLLLVRFCVSVVVSVILVSPLVIAGHSEQAAQIGGYSKPHVAQLIGVSGNLWQEMFASVPAAVVIMLLAVASLVAASGPRRRTGALYALSFAIAPVVAVWLISRGPFSYWMFRYMLFSIFGWALAAGMCIVYLAQRVKGTRFARFTGSVSPGFALAAVLIALVGLAGLHDQLNVRSYEAHNLWAYPEMPSNGLPADYKGAAAVVAAHERPGDGIIFQTSDVNHYQVNTAMEYYLRGSKLPTPVFQAQTEVQTNSLQPASRQLAGCASDPSSCLKGTPRIWVVYVDHLAPNPFSAIDLQEASYLQVMGYQTQKMWQVNGMTVALLTVA
ncbi:MAG TPA: glycosyltransferase family 39 protein [Trebonia sp.]|nr:glycosyltransferase family 39 protein [Trebonia sp.]